ncbi:TIGR03564 family F420-dependent LLM class oxidoreductase [Fodinicola acaciae]|uniref:TIGR03564 family F420-dependent LLM class oxidoreductase n=1 Tax=Fodinicola acaciae TaxID=2681555 RepID=UPI0013D13D60|nr:TIGR03564 family F420-dependent LLM class oxidoreductase [Fodinicola acaciae]
MRIGLLIDERGKSLDELTAEATAAKGLAGFWTGQHYDWDPLSVLAATAPAVPGIELGTAIVPTFPLHPLALASQALSVQAMVGNRLTLGVGLSHRVVIEERFGISYDRPARHLREYLSALVPLLHGESIAYEGETLKAAGAVTVPGSRPPGVLVSALGPVTLRIAGELTDGTITNWAGPATLADHVVPAISSAASATPRIVAAVMVSVTSDEAAVRGWVKDNFGMASTLPSYRSMLEREGAGGVEDVVVVGDESSVERQLQRQLDAGATEFIAFPLGSAADRARTTDLLVALNA